MKSVLLIWEEVPETTKLFVIPVEDVTADLKKALESAHGKHINGEDSEDVDALRDWLIDPATGLCKQEKYQKPVDCSTGGLTNQNIVSVYLSGFYL